MKRRTFLAAALAAPAVAKAESARVLKFIPQSDPATLDPMFTTASSTRCHALANYDTLYGMDNDFQANPQMAAGHVIGNNGLQWDIALRDGLLFHNGEKVLARDAVASIQRWWKRDGFGGQLADRTDEISAPDDKTIRFRLKKPFALVADALAVIISVPVVMPEHIAKTDPFKQVTDTTGSGPYVFKADERVPGSRVVYERFARYQPRSGGKAEFASGPKVAHFDRVEWTVIPDPSTAASALTSGEMDWWDNPTLDLIPQLKAAKNLTVAVKDFTSANGIMRFNQLFPPFDNLEIRKIVVRSIDQTEFMQAVAGATPELIRDKVGVFVPGTPMASDVGLDIQSAPKDIPALRKALKDAGYNGEKIVVLDATDVPSQHALAQVGAETLRRIGFNVDLQAIDWGTVQQRRASRAPIDKGGWSIFFTLQTSTQNVTPAAAVNLRADGAKAWYGWPNDPEMERRRAAWFDAPDLPTQQARARDIQAEYFANPSSAPLGLYFQPTAFANTLTDIRNGLPQFYGVRRV